MYKVLLIDDHDLVRNGIRRLLEDTSEVKIIGEAVSGEEGVKKAQALDPDIILLDINMPGIGGLEACHRILQRRPEQKIIILTVHTEESFPKRLLEIGAKGYLTKECTISEMMDAIKAVCSGGSYISASIAQSLALSMIPGVAANPIDSLSRREFQVMLMMAQGNSNSEISERLCLSPKTVSTYRSRLMDKLGAENELDLIKIAVAQGMIDISQVEA